MNVKKLKQCDLVVTRRYYKNLIPFDHYGVYIGNGKVLHHGVDENYKSPIIVQIVPLKSFCKGDLSNLWVEEDVEHTDKRSCMKRARLSLKKFNNHYDVIRINCEHLARWIVSGKPYSKQSKLAHEVDEFKDRFFNESVDYIFESFLDNIA